jgi:hypothetical protein
VAEVAKPLESCRLGQAASHTQPEHVSSLLGLYPERVIHVERAKRRGDHREVSHPLDVVDAATLGLEPTNSEQPAYWDKTAPADNRTFLAEPEPDGMLA